MSSTMSTAKTVRRRRLLSILFLVTMLMILPSVRSQGQANAGQANAGQENEKQQQQATKETGSGAPQVSFEGDFG